MNPVGTGFTTKVWIYVKYFIHLTTVQLKLNIHVKL